MSSRVFILFGGLSLFLLTPTLRAEEAPVPAPHVLIVGISDYKDPQIKDRPLAETDAKALYDLFLNKKYLGVKKSNIRLLLGKPDEKRDSQLASKANILKGVDWLVKEDDREDLAIFVFIGQGGPFADKEEELAYFAADTSLKDRTKTSVAAGAIGEKLNNLRSRRFCAFVDVNFKGFEAKKELKIPEAKLSRTPYLEFLGDDGTKSHGSLMGRVLFLANNGMATSVSTEKHGIFTEALLLGLKGEADKDGYEADGRVTVKELATYLDAKIHELALKHGNTFREKRQTPYILGDRTDRFQITYNPKALAKVQKDVRKLEAMAKDLTITKEILDEGRALLKQMPGVKERQELRKVYQQLVQGKTTVEALKKKREEVRTALQVEDDVAKDFAKDVLNGANLLAEDYVEKVSQGQLVAWAIRGLYRQLAETMPNELADTLASLKEKKEPELRKILIKIRKELGNREDLKKGKATNIALARMTRKLDPYTTFIAPEDKANFDKSTTGEFTGIGVQVRVDDKTRQLLIVTPLKGGPAIKEGIQAGDLITEIIREVDSFGKPLTPAEVIKTKGLSINDAIKKITGKRGTKVKLKIARKDEKKPLIVEIPRDHIQVETVMGARRKPNSNWDFMFDAKEKIGYIRLMQFNPSSAGEMIRAMRDLKKQGLKGLVLDMRFNPGGLLYSAREIADMFIDDGLIVTIKPRRGRERRLPGFSEGSYLDFPMSVMVNGSSASGAEIVAAALQDHGRAVVVGSRSFGKGSVQNINDLGTAKIKVTTATFWRPSGKNLNKAGTLGRDEDEWGVKPNKGYALKLSFAEQRALLEHQSEVEVIHPDGHIPEATTSKFKDRQLEMAINYVRDQIELGKKVAEEKKN